MKQVAKCAEQLRGNLDELRRREDLELLRKPLKDYNLFLPPKHPETSLITIEELKKLVRHWKLHEARGFWKSHPTKDELVDALIEHMRSHPLYDEYLHSHHHPQQPTAVPRSTLSPRICRTLQKDQRILVRPQFFNLFGRPESAPFVGRSRFDPDKLTVTSVEEFIQSWRTCPVQDLTPIEDLDHVANLNLAEHSVSQLHLEKQRRVSQKLTDFSFSASGISNLSDAYGIGAILGLCRAVDEQTVSNCMVTLSNLSSVQEIRCRLLDAGVLSVLGQAQTQCSNLLSKRGCALTLYYLSLEAESEDRVFNSMGSFFQSCLSSDDGSIREITLLTLNNLLPCLERHRVVELIFMSMKGLDLLGKDKHVLATVVCNMTSFSNVHFLLTELDVLAVVETMLNGANDECIYVLTQAMANMMSTPDVYSMLLSHRLLPILQEIAEYNLQPATQMLALIACQLSSQEDTAQSLLAEGAGIFEALAPYELPFEVQRVIVAGITNMTVVCAGRRGVFVEHRFHECLLRLLKRGTNPEIEGIALTGMCNLLSNAKAARVLGERASQLICVYLQHTNTALQVMGGKCFYNLIYDIDVGYACITDDMLRGLVRLLGSTDEKVVTMGFDVIQRLSSIEAAVERMVNMSLVEELERRIDSFPTSIVPACVTILAELMRCSAILEQQSHQSVFRTIKSLLLTSLVQASSAECCAAVICALSERLEHSEQLLGPVRQLLELSSEKSVMKFCATTIYNISCGAEDPALLLREEFILSTMVSMMRSGFGDIQNSIAKTLCTLCSYKECVGMLLNQHILTEFIVIAILRTSDEPVKVLCAKALFNMLCYVEHRSKLIECDVLWALLRLSRIENVELHQIGSRVVLNLTTDKAMMPALRRHHFLKELTFLTQHCNHDVYRSALQTVRLLMESQLTSTELESCYFITSNLLLGASNTDSEVAELTIETTAFVLHSLQQDHQVYTGCVKKSLLQLLHATVRLCPTHRVSILCAATLSNALLHPVASTALAPSDVFEFVHRVRLLHKAENDAADRVGEQPLLPTNNQVLLGVLVGILYTIVEKKPESASILTRSKWGWKLLRECFMQTEFDQSKAATKRCTVLAARMLQHGVAMQARQRSFLPNFLQKQDIQDKDAVLCALSALASMSFVDAMRTELLQAGTITLLNQISSLNGSKAVILEGCSGILRNISCSDVCAEQILESPSARTLLQRLVGSSDSPVIAMDCGVMLFHVGPKASKVATISPEEVIASLRIILNSSADEEVQWLCRAALVKVLDSVGQHVAPNKDLVSSILMFLQHTEHDIDPEKALQQTRPRVISITLPSPWEVAALRATMTDAQCMQTEWVTYRSKWSGASLQLETAAPRAPFTVEEVFPISSVPIAPYAKCFKSFPKRIPAASLDIALDELMVPKGEELDVLAQAILGRTAQLLIKLPEAIQLNSTLTVTYASAQEVFTEIYKGVEFSTGEQLLAITQGLELRQVVGIPSLLLLPETAKAHVPSKITCAAARSADGDTAILAISVATTPVSELCFDAYGEQDIVLTDTAKMEIILRKSVTIVPKFARRIARIYEFANECYPESEADAFTVCWSGPVNGSVSARGKVTLPVEDMPEGVYALKFICSGYHIIAKKVVQFRNYVCTEPVTIKMKRMNQ